jgi:Zn-dependent protease
MDFSYKIVSVLGIDIELHFFFLIFILIFLIFSPFISLVLMLLFFYVAVHELCHAIVARRNKIKVKKIILLPFGGIAVMDITDLKPLTEIKMALAGPLLNLILAYAFLLIAHVFGLPFMDWLTQLSIEQILQNPLEAFLFFSFYANVILGAFNLLVPAFPLDGGRIFRALLALKYDYLKATGIAKNVSLVIAGVMFFLGIYWMNLWISFIAFFIAFAAIAEYEATVLHKTLSGIKTSDLISKDFLVVEPKEPIESVVKKMVGRISPYAVVGVKKIRIVDIKSLAGIPEEKKKKLTAGDIAKAIEPVSPKIRVEKILKTMAEKNVSMLPVFEKKRFVGVIHRSDIEKMVHIKAHIAK